MNPVCPLGLQILVQEQPRQIELRALELAHGQLFKRCVSPTTAESDNLTKSNSKRFLQGNFTRSRAQRLRLTRDHQPGLYVESTVSENSCCLQPTLSEQLSLGP